MMGRWSAMRTVLAGGVAGGSLLGMGQAQTHVVKKPETVVRAVAVYEFTGEPGKVTASRVVPVSVFINGQFEDGGIYMARPVPFELDNGTVFEVEKAGAPEGSVELSYERHVQTAGAMTLEDGWLGYGKFKPKPMETLVAAKKSGPLPQVVTNGGDRPHFANKADSADANAKDKAVDRSTAAGSGTTVSADPAPDPDRPTMHKRTDTTTDSTDSKADATSGSDDPERPTLKKRTPTEMKANAKKKDLASVKGGTDLNDDPDRPNLHRGKPAGRLDEEDILPLKGLPAEMQQMVAVSDAKTRPEHEFLRVWEGEAQKAEVTAKMEEVARARLAAYGDGLVGAATGTLAAATTAAIPAGTQVSGARPGAPSSAAARTAAARARAAKAKAAAAAPPAVALGGELLKAYTLSYGGAATYVYTANSPGAGGTTRYVAVVAQRDPLGSVQVAMTSVTDSAHLDRVPWMRLVDAVDAEASNRASLLFELRGQTSRQFALYRVIGAKSEQVFATETPQ